MKALLQRAGGPYIGSQGDFTPPLGHVRFAPQSGHRSAPSACPLSAISDRTHRSKRPRYDLVGYGDKCRWHFDPERFSGLEVDHRRFRCHWGSHSWPLAANATEEVLAARCAGARLGPSTIRALWCVCLNFERGQTAH
jgi:hypothetical protein